MPKDALEFSPIYQCFENGQLYDHFVADCSLHNVAVGEHVRRRVRVVHVQEQVPKPNHL